MHIGLSHTAPGKLVTGQGLQEYALVVCPDAEVCKQMEIIEQQFYIEYGVKPAPERRPHIRVAGFQAQEVMEETLIRWIERICARQRSFSVTLNNYSGFPPHTIYLRVLDPRPFVSLGRELRAVDELIRSSWCPPAHLVSKPYLGVATRLPEQVYEQAMPQFARKTFHASFMANELLLLKKDRLSGARRTLNIFRLQPPDSCSLNAPA
ncbi:MAG: 2'-5' RNA ligase family protein [Bacteroidetes bacterium]|nr:2'-5' RNA ligase family protein [Bacteroidota bacterium]